MTNITYTPGPWFMEVEPYDSYYQISDDCGTSLAQVEAWDGDNDEELMEQARANARLIAAAPDLLEALERYFSEMEIGDEGQRDIEGFENAARAAIAKTKAA